MSDVKFVRIHGRVVPIHTGPGAKQKNMDTGKRELAKAGGALKKQAIAKANDHYNNDLNAKQQQTVKTGFKVFENINSGFGLAVGAGAALTGAKVAKVGARLADKAVDEYGKKAVAAQKKYGLIGAIGGGTAAPGVFALNVLHQRVKTAQRGLAAAQKVGSSTSMQDAAKIAKSLTRLRGGRIGAGVAVGASLVAAAVGAIGVSRAQKHVDRARQLKGVSSQLKKFVGE